VDPDRQPYVEGAAQNGMLASERGAGLAAQGVGTEVRTLRRSGLAPVMKSPASVLHLLCTCEPDVRPEQQVVALRSNVRC